MTIKIVRSLVASLVLAYSTVIWANGATPAASLDPSIHRVDLMGTWSVNNEFGRYRMVKMEVIGDHVLTRIEIQWLADEPAETGGSIIKSIPLDEVGLPMLSNTTWVVRGVRNNRLSLQVSGTLPTGQRRSWMVVVLTPGVVHVTMAAGRK
jgi:hypothetical protein